MSKFFGAKNGLLSSVIDGYAGTYSHLVIRASGTNQAGKTAAITNFGVVRVDLKGFGNIANIDMARLSSITNLFYGEIEATSGAGAALAFTVMLPLRGPDDKNVLHVDDGDLKIYMPAASGGATIFADLTYTVKGEEAFGSELYVPRLNESTETLVATYNPTLSMPNLIWLGLSTAATTQPTMITLLRDNDLVKEGSMAEMLAETNMFSEIESSTENFAILKLLASGNVLEAVGHSYKLMEVGGVGAQTIVQFAAHFDSARSAKSRVAVARVASNAATVEPGSVSVQGPVSPGPVRIVRGPTTPGWGVL